MKVGDKVRVEAEIVEVAGLVAVLRIGGSRVVSKGSTGACFSVATHRVHHCEVSRRVEVVSSGPHTIPFDAVTADLLSGALRVLLGPRTELHIDALHGVLHLSAPDAASGDGEFETLVEYLMRYRCLRGSFVETTTDGLKVVARFMPFQPHL